MAYRTRSTVIATVLAALAASLVVLPASPVEASTLSRIAGPTRIETAIAVARKGWPTAGTVVLARADDPADALAGSALAASLDAPLLVTPPSSLVPDVAATIRALGADRAVLLGGERALAPKVAHGLRAAGISKVERVAGPNRYATAAAVAARLGSADTALLVGDWRSALASAGLSARRTAAGDPWPIVLTGTELAPEATRALAAMGARRVVIVGDSVPRAADEQLRRAGYEIDRLAGSGPVSLNLALLKRDPAPAQDLLVATGRDFPDGLSAGAFAARRDASLMLVGASLTDTQRSWMTDGAGDRLTVIGGEKAVDPSVVDALAALAAGRKLSAKKPRTDGGTVDAPTAVRAGLFATAAEVEHLYRPRWDTRWSAGLADEPDHRARIEALAGALTMADVYDEHHTTFESTAFRKRAKRFDALAWRSLMTGAASDLDLAKRFIIAQAKAPNLQWGTWPTGKRDLPFTPANAHFANAHAMAGLVHGYSIVRPTMTVAERDLVDRWFVSFARALDTERRDRMSKLVRDWSAQTDPATYVWIGDHDTPISDFRLADVAYLGSPRLYNAHYQYNNRWSSMMRTVAMIGVVTGERSLKDSGARFVKESLAFGWWPQGFHVDFHRGIEDGSIAYSALALSNTITIADVLLRDGHTNLYEYGTTAGVLGSEGTFPGRRVKRLDGAIAEMAKHYGGTYRRYASTTEASGPTMGSYVRGDQTRFALANVYYRDTGVARQLYTCGGGRCDSGGGLLDDFGTLDKEAAPTLFHIAAGREDGAHRPYPTG